MQAQLVSLPNEWKFKLGDNMEWANPAFKDSGWNNKQVGAIWSVKGMENKVYAWYRTKIIISSQIKGETEKWQGIKLNLGRIYEVDQTFFNGKLIGQTGSFPPDYKEELDAERVYFISANDVQWDKENVIAVRVFSLDTDEAGMYQGPYNLAPIHWSDFITIQHNIIATANNGFTTKINFTNKSNNEFIGTVKYWINDRANNELFTQIKTIQVSPGQGAQNELSFSDFQPVNEDIFRVCYMVTENNSSDTVKNEQVYLANKSINIPVVSEPEAVVDNKVQDVFIAASFQDQHLKGYLGKRVTQNLEERLLKIDEKGIIDGYLQRPGSHPWIGEHVGKYLETACNVWKNTLDARLKKQMDRLMYELVNAQLDNGYLGTYTPNKYWTSWDVWSHKYNLYGLLAYYTTTGYQPALDACKKIGNLLCATFGNKPGQRDIISAGTHVGMAATSVLDPMVELYKYTGDKKYLNFCYYILEAWEQNNGPKIISSLLSTGKVDKVANGKAYEMLSNLVGLIKLYRVTGDKQLLKPVLIAWQDIVTNRLYITGTTSSFEHFQEDEKLPATNKDRIGEGCVTTTWIQLNQNLLAITGELKFEEQIEKSIYNQLLGAENPETGCVSYYTALMDVKPFSCDITCCTSSVPRGIAMIPLFTFGTVKNIPTLMLYEPALYKESIITAGKKNINLLIKIETNFPETGDAVITVNTSQTASFPIALRVPSWCNSFTATIGNKVYKGIANQYLYINKFWRSGDKIKVTFKIPFQTVDGGKSYPDQIAFMRGPQVLAFDDSVNKASLKALLNSEQRIVVEKPDDKVITDVLPNQWIGKQSYGVSIMGNKKSKTKNQLILVPFADASQTGGNIKVWMPLIIHQ